MAEPRKPYSFHVAQTILTPRTKDVFCGLFRRPRNLKEVFLYYDRIFGADFEYYAFLNLYEQSLIIYVSIYLLFNGL